MDNLDSDDIMKLAIAVPAIVFGCLVAITGIVTGSWTKVRVAREKEQSRRELAAYVAEGSITAEQAEKILQAGKFSGMLDQVRCGSKAWGQWRDQAANPPAAKEA
ncbi:MAG: hypothetical protein C0475_05225 [Planctomyces sp.]|nr:hypothetical protein [Planctomyces sp.]MBA4038832.1 hypothetical protein [Planctomyces sp.]MBA4120762.1 hypothetical protein [Isosphaera sp.]